MNPGPNSCFVYHNLACVQWLHMRQFTDGFSDMDNEKEQVLTDFIECVPNFQKAVQLFEGFPEYYSVESELNLKNKLSGLPLTNIAEVYFEKLEVDVFFT